MLLSHLNKQVLMQKIGRDTVVQASTAISTENGNLETARRLAAAKFKLIHTLAQFPISAQWIVGKYTQTIDPAEQAIALLSPIKKLINALENGHEKQPVVEAFVAFPFSFEDLVELVDLLVYAFQTRGLCYRFKKQTDWMAKRLKTLKRLKALQIDEVSYLMLSDETLYQGVIDTLFAEHFWLSARQQLVEKNTKLVTFIANQYKGSFLDFDDLVQEGQTGLLTAVDKFDYHLGCQFSTYAAYWIRQRILRALSRNERVVRIPCEQISHINRLFRAKNELLASTGEEPSVEALASYLKMSNEEINAILAISQTALPLENFDTDEETPAPIDLVEQQVFETPFKQLAQSELENWLALAIKTLNARESKVVCYHFGLHTDSEMTLQEIGAELNISRERVRQIQVTAFHKMKLSYGEQLVSFLS